MGVGKTGWQLWPLDATYDDARLGWRRGMEKCWFEMRDGKRVS